MSASIWKLLLPEVTEKPHETSTEENHEVIVLLSRYLSEGRREVGNQIVGILLVRVEHVVLALRRY